MKTQRLGKIGGALYILMAIITLYNLFLSYNPTNKIFVFLLANWKTLLLSIFYVVIAVTLLKNHFGYRIFFSLLGCLILSCINVFKYVAISILNVTLLDLLQILYVVVPNLLLFIFAVKCLNNKPIKLYYLPSIIYLIFNIYPIITIIMNFNAYSMAITPLLNVLHRLIITFAYLTLGKYLKEY
jgi:hypothetical protein